MYKFNEQVLNVLLISNEEKSHYVFIKDFNRLMYSKTKHKDRKHFCMLCLQNFTAKEILNNHRERCLLINDTQAVKYETGTIKFRNFHNQKPVPFKVYANSKCMLKRVNIKKSGYTKLYQKHVPNSMVGAKLVFVDNRFNLPTKTFTGSNCAKEFFKWISEQQKYFKKIINKYFNEKLKMTTEDDDDYRNSNDYCICSQKIKDEDKARYCCIVTGEYKGPAHKECNKIP